MRPLNWQVLITGILVGLIASGVIIIVARQPRGYAVNLKPITTPVTISIDISGAINHPGLYKIPTGGRMEDAVLASGGLTSQADINKVNLAARLTDGQKISIPYLGESNTLSTKTPSSISDFSKILDTPSAIKLINLNRAGSDELQSLPGIGSVRAQQIIEFRIKIGNYTNLEQLLEIPGIGQNLFDRIRPYLTVDGSP